jgi:cyclic beta-1,2-glucan synthetase
VTFPRTHLPALASFAEAVPHARLLSNGRYTSLVTGAGTGYATCDGVQLTAWVGDRVEDADGVFVYLQDLDDGLTWSVGAVPLGTAGRSEASYRPGVVKLTNTRRGIESELEICVAPDADAELRRLRVRNVGAVRRRIAVTAYAGVVLHDPAAHAAHPAFSKLFVETAIDEASGVLRARRRPRGPVGPPMHLAAGFFGPGALEWETDRTRFVGRGRTLASARALESDAPLSGSTGSVLDPILALRRTVDLEPGDAGAWSLVLGCAASPEAATELASRYAEPGAVVAARVAAEARARRLLEEHQLTDVEGEYLHELAGAMLYGDPELRAGEEVLRRCRGAIPDLLGQALRSDRPLVVLEAMGRTRARLTSELLRALDYWTAHGLPVQARVVTTEPLAILALLGERDAVRVIERAKIDPRVLDVVRAMARLAFDGRWPKRPRAHGRGRRRTAAVSVPRSPRRGRTGGRLASNGFGGFVAGGREYVLDVPAAAGERPPMPWCNVLANDRFGCLVSESGAGCTWSRNSREHRVTPWSNDPLLDPHGEALYVRDEDRGAFWSPQPGPVGRGGTYEVTHGFGYSRWRHVRDELVHEVDTFVAVADPVRFTRLRIENTSGRSRRLTVYAYQRLVLGVLPEEVGHAVVSEQHAASGALLATSGLAGEFADGVVFAAAAGPAGTPVEGSADRAAFLGRGGSPAAPVAVVAGGDLETHVGAGLDPCFVQRLVLEIAPGASAECVFVLGESQTREAALELAQRAASADAAREALAQVQAAWEEMLGAVRVETPVPALDLVANGWLAYQTLACRIWGRSAFYQSGGAFGFRDQLQDAAALVWMRPAVTRAQILLHAAHQFVEGDVLHWWHPPSDRGTRTRFSDDLLWLPYVTAGYVAATGDTDVLDELVPFVNARLLAEDEDETLVAAQRTQEQASLYEHCCLALDRSLTRGAHGLPLMGTGDWNDGMNLVGREGRGESVWLGFFLAEILDDVVPLCEARGDTERAARYRAYREALGPALEEAWDGAWYRRAYFDDGTPLGTAGADECRIDVLPQAWAVISGAVGRERAGLAMDAVERELVLDPPGMIRLLAPPFDHAAHEPGYIKGYVPGIRENGGQYTHGALWAVQAMAELDRRDRAAALLEMLSPVTQSRTPEAVARYQVEPYVVVADIYSAAAHRGRGGWTWYTGSAGWMLRVTLESLLGCRLEGGRWLRVRPRIPDAWGGFRLTYRLPDRRTVYEVAVENPAHCAAAVVGVTVDGTAGAIVDGAARVPLAADGAVHQVVVRLGAATAEPAASK